MGFKTSLDGTKRKPRAIDGARSSSAVVGFSSIYDRAVARKGSGSALAALLPSAKSKAALRKLGDDRYLAAMARNIFRAGFVWKVVENKWPGFEAAFGQFAVLRNAAMDELDVDELAKDTRIIRNRGKVAAVRDNARFVLQMSEEHGSFGAYLAKWPDEDLVGLWSDLQKRGSRLGGFTRAVFLREVGKDTFMLSDDVVRALIGARVVDKEPTSQRDLAAVQAAFNTWRAETGRPFCELSRILACSVDS